MKLRVQNLHTEVMEISQEEKSWLHHFLTFRDQTYEGETIERLYNLSSGKFPTGMMAVVKKGAAARKYSVEVEDARHCPGTFDHSEDLEWLKKRKVKRGDKEVPYQYDSICKALKVTRGIIRSPTGSGKGEIAVGIAKSTPIKWLFLVHRSNLRDDICERYNARGDGTTAHRAELNGWKLAPRFTVATFQTLYRHLDKPEVRKMLAEVEGIIVDECHAIAAQSHLKVSNACPNAYYRIGLSGTPLDREDNKSLTAVAALGPICAHVTYRELSKAGYVADPQIHFEPVHQVEVSGSTWNSVYSQAIVRSAKRNAKVVEAVKRVRHPCMLFVERVEHGDILKKLLTRAGFNTAFISGVTKDREGVAKGVKTGDVDVLISNKVLQEGLDISEFRSVVLAQGMKAKIMVLQRIGRGMRLEIDPTTGKVMEGSRTFDVVDFYDTGHTWIAKHSEGRKQAYLSVGYTVTEGVALNG